jgi:hypothetical protein
MTDLPFLEQMASARSKAEFDRTAAGFAAVQVYRTIRRDGYDPKSHGDALCRIRDDLAAITSETRIHAALQSLVEVLPFWGQGGDECIGSRAVYTALIIYGRALGDEGEWSLARLVFSIVGEDSELDGETWTSAEARLMMGRASRMCADWEASRTAYARAYQLGMEAGDFSISLRARIGEANNLWSRGDFPAARQILNTTARRARELCPEVLPRVTLAIAGVANAAGEYERAIHLAFGLLASLDDDDELRNKTLIDLAAFLTDYGLPDVASTALRIVERVAPETQVRVHARLNLFFLAARHEDEASFNALRAALSAETLTPRQRTQYALFSAQGYRRFGNTSAALDSVQQAVELANKYELFQLMFEAESELHALQGASAELDDNSETASDAPRQVRARAAAGPDDSNDVIEAIFDRSARRTTVPPKIQRVADSLKTMAAKYALASPARGDRYKL